MNRLPKAFFRGLILIPLCLWAIANWWQAGRDIARFYVDLPVWDYFDLVDHYAHYGTTGLKLFWVPHNEHRIVFPEIVIALDFLLFHGRIVLPTMLSYLFFLGIWIVMVWAFVKDRAVDAFPRYAAILLAAILMVWKGCTAALAQPFLLQWTMNQLAAILSLAFIAQFWVDRRRAWLVSSVVCGFICTYSSGNGLFIWPLLICVALFLHLPKPAAAVILLTGVFSSGLYFIGYTHLDTHTWRLPMTEPIYLIEFVASYLSMPFAILRWFPEFGVKIGLVSLAVMAGVFLLAKRQKLLACVPSVVLFGYIVYIVLTGIMIAAGRMNPADSTLTAPKAIRYLTLPLTYWAAVAIVCIWVLARVRLIGTVLSATLAVALGLLLFRMLHKASFAGFAKDVAKMYADMQWSALAVQSGILDPATDSILFPDVQFVHLMEPILRTNQLSLFSYAEPSWIGRDAREIFPESLYPTVSGGIVASHRLQTTVTIEGWTNDIPPLFQTLELVLVDENNRIVGIGERLRAGLPTCFSHLKIPYRQQWTAFVNLTYHSHTVSPFIVAPHNKALIPLPAKFDIESASR